MQIPQALPPRSTDFSTDDTAALSAAQPERGREYVQLRAGSLRAELRERLYGSVGVSHERWSCALRVRCARSRRYVAFSLVSSETAPTWCGVALAPGEVIEVDREWELATRAPLESVSFAVEAKCLEQVEIALAGNDIMTHPTGNRVLAASRASAVGAALRDRVFGVLDAGPLSPEAQRSLESDLAHLAARLRRPPDADARPEAWTRRRRAVHRVEAYLAAYPHAVLSLAALCSLAGVGERTLEYAFREQLGVPPARYLRLRRLNAVHRELRSAESTPVRITDVAMRWGFWELGRFASEYRALFGELPSETVASRRR